MKLLHVKAHFTEAKTDANGRKVFTFRASTGVVDRQDEIVTTDGWETQNYERNPVILDAHNYGTIKAILGKSVTLRQTPDGPEIDVQFAKTAEGQYAEQLVDDGMLNAVSVGFRSLDRKPGTKPGDPLQHTKKELLEVSMVPVPANPEALRLRGMTAATVKVGDFQAVVNYNDALSDLYSERWQLCSALDTANMAAAESDQMTPEERLAAIATNYQQYTDAMLAWWGRYITLDDAADEAGIDPDRYCGVTPTAQEPAAIDQKAGRRISAATAEQLHKAMGQMQEAMGHKKAAMASARKAMDTIKSMLNPERPSDDPDEASSGSSDENQDPGTDPRGVGDAQTTALTGDNPAKGDKPAGSDGGDGDGVQGIALDVSGLEAFVAAGH